MSKKSNANRLGRLVKFLGTQSFFKAVLVLLVLQSVWIAFSARYPMAFDEDFHLGLIKLYAHHISPFWESHPANSDAFGALTRDPSYLYHYLISFPYRLITLITSNLAAQVVILRLINIGLFVGGIILYQKLLLQTKASQAIVNLALLVFILIPIVPYLAGQINYDNLILPLTALSLLITLRVYRSMAKGGIDVLAVLYLVTLLMITSIVKYAFLPVAVAIAAFLIVSALRIYGISPKVLYGIKSSAQKISKTSLIIALLLILVSGSLFVERYGVNLVKYHKPVADCGEVLDFEHCKSYGPWIRDYYLAINKGDSKPNPVSYSQDWLQGMWFRSFFAISGAYNDFRNSSPLTYPAVGTIIFASAGLIAFILTAKRLWRRYDSATLWLLTVVSGVYLVVLWHDQYDMYVKSGVPVAINGRYLLPILPIGILLSALAMNLLLMKREKLKLVLGATVIFCYLWGGGVLTYILRADNVWYWPNTPLKPINNFIKDNIGPYTPGFRRPTQYMPD